MLEEPFDNGYRPLRLHAKDGIPETGRRRGSEAPRPLETRSSIRQICKGTIDPLNEHSTGGLQVAGRYLPIACHLPCPKKLLEDLMDQLAASTRIHHFFVVGFLLDPQ